MQQATRQGSHIAESGSNSSYSQSRQRSNPLLHLAPSLEAECYCPRQLSYFSLFQRLYGRLVFVLRGANKTTLGSMTLTPCVPAYTILCMPPPPPGHPQDQAPKFWGISRNDTSGRRCRGASRARLLETLVDWRIEFWGWRSFRVRPRSPLWKMLTGGCG
jgi:hypothetical protein